MVPKTNLFTSLSVFTSTHMREAYIKKLVNSTTTFVGLFCSRNTD